MANNYEPQSGIVKMKISQVEMAAFDAPRAGFTGTIVGFLS
jgi:hypothetical protein